MQLAGEMKSVEMDESEHRPTFSLIVPTVDRTKELGALFESIVASQVTDLEVIVVDQNRDGSLDDICQRYSWQLSLNHFKVKFIGAARAENAGGPNLRIADRADWAAGIADVSRAVGSE